jgi:pyruvate dehydrogenase E1 component alpha subunit
MAAAADQAVARARAGEGPTLIEAMTYRIRNHAEGLEKAFPDSQPREEIDRWLERDPIRRHREALVAAGVDAGEIDAIDAEIDTEIDEAVEFARASEPPDPAAAFRDVWKEAVS